MTGLDRRVFLATGAAALSSPAIAAIDAREGFARVPGGKVWWRTVGSSRKTAILTLHGGPGAGHNYLEPLAALKNEREVVFYDQLGCGLSDAPKDPSLWRIERFVREIDALREALKLDRVILYGHSWGGWLALEYMATRGQGVMGLVLASTSASLKQYEAGTRRRLKELPNHVGERAAELEAAGRTNSPEYKKIVELFDATYLMRLKKPPAFSRASGQNVAKSPTYVTMQGPNEFTVTGNLKDWNRERDLARIKIPTLILTSEFDEVTLDCSKTLQAGIAGSKLVIIPGAAHLSMVEKPDVYVSILRDFLSTV